MKYEAINEIFIFQEKHITLIKLLLVWADCHIWKKFSAFLYEMEFVDVLTIKLYGST